MPKPTTILAIGEVLWDVFPDGPRFGGALANFACCSAELGASQARVALSTAVGKDDLGRDAVRNLQIHGVDPSLVVENDLPTGRVDVELDELLRASYTFLENAAWDHATWSEELGELASRADVIGFGTLGQRGERSRETIQRVLRSASAESLRILDLNLRPPFWNAEVVLESLRLSNVLKLNDEELPILAEILKLSGSEESLLRQIMSQCSLRVVALTRGADGSFLMDNAGGHAELPGRHVSIVDTVGAGDSFTAALALGLSQNMPLTAINRWATEVASFVCTQPGGTPRIPTHLHLGDRAK